MGNDKVTKPPMAGIIYGEITRWMLFTGIIIAVIGMIVYFINGGSLNQDTLVTNLWKSADCHTIWQTGTLGSGSFQPRWYLTELPKGDAIAMLGIAVTCFSGVLGMWGALLGTIRSKGGIYIAFACIVAVVLTLSALGILTLET